MNKETRKLLMESCEKVIKCNGLCEYSYDKCKDCINLLICENDPNKETTEKLELIRHYIFENYNNLNIGLEISPIGDCFICPSRFKVDHNNLCRAFGQWLHQGDIIECCDECINHRKEH